MNYLVNPFFHVMMFPMLDVPDDKGGVPEGGVDPLTTDVDPDDVDPELDPEPETDPELDPEPETDPELDPEPEPQKQEPDDNTDWVKKRLVRAERSFERKFLEEAASESEGVQVDRKEIPKAVKLWNLLRHNSELSKQIDDVITKALTEGKAKPLISIRPEAKFKNLNAALDLKEAELELRYSDPVYKKYEQAVKDWAEDEGLDITNPKTLKLAVRAWKSDNQVRIVADRTKAGAKAKAKAPITSDPAKKKAALAGGRSPVKGAAPIDYRKASDNEILTSLNLKLFVDDN